MGRPGFSAVQWLISALPCVFLIGWGGKQRWHTIAMYIDAINYTGNTDEVSKKNMKKCWGAFAWRQTANQPLIQSRIEGHYAKKPLEAQQQRQFVR